MSAFAVAVVVNAADDVVVVEPAAVVVATGVAVAEAEIAAAVVSGATGHTSSHSKTN